MKILFVTSETFPLMKTGGLGDVCGALPPALLDNACDVRILMPAYRDTLAAVETATPVAQLQLPNLPDPINVIETKLPGTSVRVWLLDYAPAYDRAGNPYHDEQGNAWEDNAARFALLSRAAVAIALGKAGISWQPDVVHCHDWQAGLAPAWLAEASQRPATIFTIHNLAYQGLFPPETLQELDLPLSWWSFDALEYHGQLSFIKGGLVFADWITTVSPTYAQEIQTPEFGHGMDGVLRYRTDYLSGILNGVDNAIWDPANDPNIAVTYTKQNLDKKYENKSALQKRMGLSVDDGVFLLGTVGRLVHQKGMDLILGALPTLMKENIQLVAIGTGEKSLEQALLQETAHYTGQCKGIIGYDEELAHQIVAGSDAFLMPSRFEPCGLSQMYSQRYGTLPIVRHVGGLADTVVDGKTGISFDTADIPTFTDTALRAYALFNKPKAWRKLMTAGMRLNHSWQHRAADYVKLYRRAIRNR